MKNILYSLILALLIVGFASAAKPSLTCKTIQDGTLTTSGGVIIPTGFMDTGYNYQAHLYNALYGEDMLVMKWNDAWLSNQDCDGDKLLDRHYGYPSYIGSGAWLTNHWMGNYEGDNYVFNSLNGQYAISFVLGGTYTHDLLLTNTAGILTGNGGYPVGGPYSYTWDITSGTVVGDTLSFDAVYTGGPDAVGVVMHVTGTIQPDGSVSGTWDDNYGGGYREGTWSANGMTVKETCYWDDFIKIVAVPADAVLVGGSWYTPDGVLIGASIWNEFAIIQEVWNDPCAGYDGLYVRGDTPAGFGFYKA